MDKRTKRTLFRPRFNDGRAGAEDSYGEEREERIDEVQDMPEETKHGLKRRLEIFVIAVMVMVGTAEAADAWDIDVAGLIPGLPGRHLDADSGEIAGETAGAGEAAGADEVDEAGAAEDEQEIAEELAAQLKVVEHDINYSQSDKSFERDGVHVLLRVRNKGDVKIGKIRFKIVSQGRPLRNTADGSDEFTAFGSVAKESTGFLHACIHVPDGTAKGQGQILITEACEPDPAHPQPKVTGRVCGFDRDSDTYDVKVTNEGEQAVEAEGAYVIALQKKCRDLADSWGAGRLREDIPAEAEVTLREAIYNPGFDSYGKSEYEVFVITEVPQAPDVIE